MQLHHLQSFFSISPLGRILFFFVLTGPGLSLLGLRDFVSIYFATTRQDPLTRADALGKSGKEMGTRSREPIAANESTVPCQIVLRSNCGLRNFLDSPCTGEDDEL